MKLSRKKQHAKKNLKNKLNPVRFAIRSQKAFIVIFIFKKEVVWTKQNIFPLHYIKSVQIQFFLSDSRKIRNRKTPYFDTFHIVLFLKNPGTLSNERQSTLQ